MSGTETQWLATGQVFLGLNIMITMVSNLLAYLPQYVWQICLLEPKSVSLLILAKTSVCCSSTQIMSRLLDVSGGTREGIFASQDFPTVNICPTGSITRHNYAVYTYNTLVLDMDQIADTGKLTN